PGIQAAGQSVFDTVGDIESFRQIFGPDHAEHGTEYLFLRQIRTGIDVREDVRTHEVTAFRRGFGVRQPRRAFCFIDGVADSLISFAVDDRTHDRLRLMRREYRQTARGFDQAFNEAVVNIVENDRAAARRT